MSLVIACDGVPASQAYPQGKLFKLVSTLLGLAGSLAQYRHLLPATIMAWQIKLRVTLHLSAVTQRIQMDRWYFSDHIKVKVN